MSDLPEISVSPVRPTGIAVAPGEVTLTIAWPNRTAVTVDLIVTLPNPDDQNQIAYSLVPMSDAQWRAWHEFEDRRLAAEVGTGRMTVNEARAALDMPPLDIPEADQRSVRAGNTVTFLGDPVPADG